MRIRRLQRVTTPRPWSNARDLFEQMDEALAAWIDKGFDYETARTLEAAMEATENAWRDLDEGRPEDAVRELAVAFWRLAERFSVERDEDRNFNRQQREQIYLQAQGRCQRCGAGLDATWEPDHITPHAWGGWTSVENGQALCRPCNREKHARPAPAERAKKRRR